MAMKYICSKHECTACGACEKICPSRSIVKEYLRDGTHVYMLNEKTCSACGLCKKVCPNISRPDLRKPIKSFAGWSNDEEIYVSAASGGIATELYLDAIARDMLVAGVKLTSDFKCKFELTNKLETVSLFKNSKYTFSDIGEVYNKIVEAIQNNHNVLFIGMPCQVAAVKNFVAIKKCSDKVFLVDLTCHGLPAEMYFPQHIKWIEEKNKKNVARCFFRDPQYNTNSYAMTAYDSEISLQSGKPFYCRYVCEDDLYQIGYHSAAIYRENCYSCKYAQAMRVGDLTLGDYYGLGEDFDYVGEKREVSFIFANTKKGLDLLKRLNECGIISLHERPIEEALRYQKPLNSPPDKPKERESFINLYEECQLYDKAAKGAFGKTAKWNMIKKIFYVNRIKKIAKKVLPKVVIKAIRKIRRM